MTREPRKRTKLQHIQQRRSSSRLPNTAEAKQKREVQAQGSRSKVGIGIGMLLLEGGEEWGSVPHERRGSNSKLGGSCTRVCSVRDYRIKVRQLDRRVKESLVD
jgi:hypothetical protein